MHIFSDLLCMGSIGIVHLSQDCGFGDGPMWRGQVRLQLVQSSESPGGGSILTRHAD